MRLSKKVFSPAIGENIGDCIIEAIEWAVKPWLLDVTIEFTHNDRLYQVTSKELVEYVHNKWRTPKCGHSGQ